MHAFWLDKTEHGSWPYSVYNAAEGFYRFASEPVVADLDNNGSPEVLFASWTQKGSGQTGKLYILDNQGNPLQVVTLPVAFGSPDWNGALAAPTLANIDADADLELLLNTAHSGLVAYDLPGTRTPASIGAPGEGNYQRTGSHPVRPLQASTISVTPALPEAGDILTYTITLRNPGPILPSAWLTDTLPAGLTYLGGLAASSGSTGQSGGVITWTGSVPVGASVTITFRAQLNGLPVASLPGNQYCAIERWTGDRAGAAGNRRGGRSGILPAAHSRTDEMQDYFNPSRIFWISRSTASGSGSVWCSAKIFRARRLARWLRSFDPPRSHSS